MVVIVDKIVINPTVGVGKVMFGCTRDQTRKVFGKKYKEIKKSNFSENTMDAYDDYHVYFSKDNTFEAVEVFGNIEVVVEGKTIFPGKVDALKETFPRLVKDDYGMIDYEKSVAIIFSEHDEKLIGSILFGRKGYFD